MQFDATLPNTSLRNIPAIASTAESLGFGAVWAAETQHDPLLAAVLTAEHTSRIQFGTAIAVAFSRSPATLAYTAWDLAEASGGRFILGLGTQVKAHIQRRFGMEWPESVIGKFREQIQAIRAFWNTWQTGERLNFRGRHYKLTLMTPFFSPGPIEHPDIPIYVAGVNPGLAGLAGELADGFHVHPLHSLRYLREVLRPAIQAGARKVNRSTAEIKLVAPVFVVTSPQEEAEVRRQIAFYASTPSYRSVLALHGWDELGQQLSSRAARGQWDAMPALISDEMLATFAVPATPETLAEALEERYQGLVDRITPYVPFVPGERDEFWRKLLQ